MARKNKTQVAVEEFASTFENLVVDQLSDVDPKKIETYLFPDLANAVLYVLKAQEEEPKED
jgi:hypothetical protein